MVAPAPAQLALYTDFLRNGFADWSWGTPNLAQTADVHAGSWAKATVPFSALGLLIGS